jgi:hypothetical protein
MKHVSLSLVPASVLCMAAIVAASEAQAEAFVALGVTSSRVEADIAAISVTSKTSTGLHIGAGVRRELAGGGNIGVRLELDDVDSNLLLAARALDYRRPLSDRLAIGAFLGAARLNLATPAYGYYLGGGVELTDLLPGWSLSIDLRLGDKIARDHLLPSDAQIGRPDDFYDLRGISVYLSHRF